MPPELIAMPNVKSDCVVPTLLFCVLGGLADVSADGLPISIFFYKNQLKEHMRAEDLRPY